MLVDARPTHPLLKTILKINNLFTKTGTGKKIKVKSETNHSDDDVVVIESSPEPESFINKQRKPSVTPPPSPVLTSYMSVPATGADEDERRCPGCKFLFNFPSRLKEHLKTTSCGSSPTASTSNQTTDTGTNSTAQKCPFCSKQFMDIDNLRKHIALHSVSRQRGFPCRYCAEPRDFRNSILLNDHVKSYHDKEKPYNCSKCRESFRTSDERKLHDLNTHLKDSAANSLAPDADKSYLTCELCSHVSSNKAELISHRKIVHKIITPPVGCNTTSDNIEELCSTVTQHSVQTAGQGFWENYNESQQSDEYYSEATGNWGQGSPFQEENQQQPEQPFDQEFTCTVCRKVLSSKIKLGIHKRFCDPSSLKYKCDFCLARFSLSTSKNHHMRRHKASTGTSEFPCRVCKMDFNESLYRNRHEEKCHTSEELDGISNTQEERGACMVKCRYCNIKCSNLSDRTIHERRFHTDELGAMTAKNIAAREGEQVQQASPESQDVIILDYPEDPLTTNNERGQRAEGSDSMHCHSHTVTVSSYIAEHAQTDVDEEEQDLPRININVNAVLEDDAASENNVIPENILNVDFSEAVQSSNPQQQTNSIYSLSVAEVAQQLTSLPTIVPLITNYKDGRYNCQFCFKQFADFINLSSHLDQHSYCAVCEKIYATVLRFKQHLLSQHDQIRKLFCQICCQEFVFSDIPEFVVHLKSVHDTTNDVNLRCTKCTKSFSSVAELRIHINSAHINRPVQPAAAARAQGTVTQFNYPPVGIQTVPSSMAPQNVYQQRHLPNYPNGQSLYVNSASAQNHQASTSTQSVNTGYWNPGPPFNCHLCGQNFVTHSALLRHRIYVHNYSSQHPQSTCPSESARPPITRQVLEESVRPGLSGSYHYQGQQGTNVAMAVYMNLMNPVNQESQQLRVQEEPQQLGLHTTEVLLPITSGDNFIDESVEDECMILG